MALVSCPDCGQSISAAAPVCIHCGRPMTAQAVAAEPAVPEPPTADSASPEPRAPAVAPTLDEFSAPGWILWRGDRQFGPMTGQELADYFTSKMALASDAVTGPAWPERVPAAEAAALLEVPAPLPGAAPAAPVAAPIRPYVHEEEEGGLHVLAIAVWLAVLFGLQLQLTYHASLLSSAASSPVFGPSLYRFFLIAAACFGGLAVLGKMVNQRFPSAVWPLFAMTIVYGVLFGKSLMAEPEPAPAAVAATVSESAATPPSESTTAVASASVPAQAQTQTTQQPTDVPVDTRPGWTDWYGIASALRDKKDWQGLLEHTTLWTDAEPNAGNAWAFQSIAYDGLGRYADAVQADLQTTTVAPDQIYGWMNLASDDFNVKDYAGAAAASRKAIAIDGSNAHAWNSLGAALQDMNQLDEAMDAYQHAVANDPHYAAGWENLGSQYYRKKQWDDAIKAWQTVLTMEPHNRVAASGITNAQQMKALAQ